MTVVLHHVALALAVGALAAGAVRLASRAAPAGVERVLAAVALAAAAAVLEALALALASLGGSAVALLALSLASWLAARAALPAPALTVRAELARGVRDMRPLVRAVAGAAFGAWLAWAVWLALHPALGHDMIVYHLPEAVSWVHDGRPGSVLPIIANFPVGSYQLGYEVMLGWGLALGRGFDWVVAVTAAMPALVAVAAWAGLRALRVGDAVAWLGAAALAVPPAVLGWQRGGSAVDPAALAFLLSAAALAISARERPRLAGPAMVAAGLAAGCKATALPLAAAVAVIALTRVRAHWRPLRAWLGTAAAAAAVAGGVWYLRDLVVHGSPIWPFQATPWGDPRPRFFQIYGTRFADRPGATLTRLWPYYRDDFGGPLILLAGALVAPLLARRRAVVAAAAAAALAVLVWTTTSFTGIPPVRGLEPGAADTTRYLLPGVALAVLAIALASRHGRVRPVATALLGAAAVVGLWQTLRLGFPVAPSGRVPLAGGLAGAALGTAIARMPRFPRVPAFAAAALALAAGSAGGVLVAHGFVARHADTGLAEARVPGWLAGRADWRDGGDPVLFTFSLNAAASGDRIQHGLVLVTPRIACARAAGLHGWLVADLLARRDTAAPCGRPAYDDGQHAVYPPGGLTSPPARRERGRRAAPPERARPAPRRATRSTRRRAPRARRAPARRSPRTAGSGAVRRAPAA